MRGQVLGYDQLAGEGIISGEDGARYTFRGTEWKSNIPQLKSGSLVDFETKENSAISVFVVPPVRTGLTHVPGEKSHMIAGVLALFLGGIGIHKFYMGYEKEGVILVVASVISWLLLSVGIGAIGILLVGLICLGEAITYFIMDQERFVEVYIDGRKHWF